jgi:DNA anti-recombination protein RmuC
MLLFILPNVRSQDEKILFESLKLGDTVVRNVRVTEATPTHVTLSYDGGASRLKRQDLPAQLRALYPYDAKEADRYEKQQAIEQDARNQKTRARQEQSNRELKASLLQQQQTTQAKIQQLQSEMNQLEKEMGPMRAKAQGKKNSAARKELDAARDKKQDYIRRIGEQQKQLDHIRKQLDTLP